MCINGSEYIADHLIANGVTFNRDIHWATEQAYKNGKADAMKWIPVTERLPEDNSDVLGYMQNGAESKIFPATYCRGWWHDCIDNIRIWSVTHWMPLPPCPEDTK